MIKIFIEEINAKNIQSAINFILPFEYKCINLADCLKRKSREYNMKKNSYSFEKGFIIFSENIENKNLLSVEAVIFINSSKIILHAIPKISLPILNSLSYIFKRIDTAGIMGEEKGCCAIQEILKKKFNKMPIKYTDYKLLIFQKWNDEYYKSNLDFKTYLKYEDNCALQSETFMPEIKSAIKIETIEFVEVSADDAERLLPLNIAYEKEELSVPENTFPYNLLLMLFKKKLEKEIVFAAKIENSFIGKAGTNAQGFFWNQIGGVYVKPEYRNLGIGTELIKVLLNNFYKEKKYAALFVKKTNKPALKVYLKAGFKEVCNFKIVQF